jgi:GIY-YIG catalytic domain
MKFVASIALCFALLLNGTALHAKPPPAKQSGTYSFKSSNGKPYIGKSNDVDRRLKEHQRSGKLNPKDKGTIQTEPNGLGKRGNGVVERTKIRAADAASKGGLANKQNAPFSRKNK